MSAEQPLFDDSMPRDYENYLGPLLFESYAADLAGRLEIDPGGALLETACGTGIATEFLRRSIPSDVEIVATDVSEPMLEQARARRSDLEQVSFRHADAAALPFPDDAFDGVVQQFGLMFVPDKLQSLREAHRVLRPGGRLVFSVWDDLASNPYVQVAQDAIAGFFEAEPPQFLYLPWSYHDHATLRELVAEAGFVRCELDTVAHQAERPTSRDAAMGLVRGNPTILDIRKRAQATPAEVVDAVAESLGQAFGEEPFRAPMQAIVVTAERGDP